MDEECESAIGQLAISSQFGREAARILTLAEYKDPKRKLTARDIDLAGHPELRAALGCQKELGSGRTSGSQDELRKRLRKFHGVDAPSS